MSFCLRGDRSRRSFYVTEIKDLLEVQRKWQQSLRELPWAEKIRIAEKLRDSVEKLRQSGRERGSDTSDRASDRDIGARNEAKSE